MGKLTVFHAADLHYCPRHIEWVDRAFSAAVSGAIERNCDLAVIAGDSFDASMGIHEPAFVAYVRQIMCLASCMPVMILQGTFSHDRPGALDLFKTLETAYPILVADEPGAHYLLRDDQGSSWAPAIAAPLDPTGVAAIVSVLPSLNKADPDVMDRGAAAWARERMAGFADLTRSARASGIPSLLVTHGTVTGSVTESGFAMVSPDHEFSAATLLAADCDAVLLGHIHKHQSWTDATPSGAQCIIAYPGSIARLVHGHNDPVGYLIWTIDPGNARFEFHGTPARRLVDIVFDGPPDMDDLRECAAGLDANDHVRIRWHIDQEHAHSIDKTAIRDLFGAAGSVKLEGTVDPIVSVRAGGIAKAHTLDAKLALWAQTTGDTASVPALAERLDQLRTADPEVIVARIVGGLSEENGKRGSSMSTVADMFDSIDEFDDLLSDATDRASGDWEIEFVSDIAQRYEDYEDRMFMSEKQIEILERIAKR